MVLSKGKFLILLGVLLSLMIIFGIFKDVFLVMLITSFVYLSYAFQRLHKKTSYDEVRDQGSASFDSEMQSQNMLEKSKGYFNLPKDCVSAIAGTTKAFESNKT